MATTQKSRYFNVKEKLVSTETIHGNMVCTFSDSYVVRIFILLCIQTVIEL